ncbi:four-carbon acid sugar kinase family protein [Acidithiobacillus sp. AMEEHan]|uniref:four-carbon acid sugar kinase family protein n=1 Tax=Acidithiobacillus sp. AMEEHan TaxID=2994951 RepID=UPI0027E4D89E|nr:four-carbon acid sugar kinase family protein [Acidithiobacillus sp. AMEEHan]
MSKIIVIDDDPTGSQTVHSCLLLTRWDAASLRSALDDPAPLFFLLANTRALPAAAAAHRMREICSGLRAVLAARPALQPLIVSRSDSTLRGHYPLETDILSEELGPFDALFLVPAFFEGGRITRGGTQYLLQDGRLLPVHETEFAKDSVFSFHHSYLPDYVEEKTGGRIPAAAVRVLRPADLAQQGKEILRTLTGNVCVVVDAETPADLVRFANTVRAAQQAGKRFLFRSAASLLTALADLPPQPVAPEAMGRFRRGNTPGVVLVGSHVRKSSEQLEVLLQEEGVAAIMVDVDRCQGASRAAYREELLGQSRAFFDRGLDLVIYTSREERRFTSDAERLAFGEAVSRFLMELLQGLPREISFLIAKGGITSNDTLSEGLALAMVRSMGQILPGCSLVLCPPEHPRFPALPVVIFPGNVGNRDALALVRRRLRGEAA